MDINLGMNLLTELMSYLVGDIDLVPSDLAAGLIILHLKSQAESNTKEFERAKDSSPAVVSSEPPRIIDELERTVQIPTDIWNSQEYIAHFMKFALGSYGWPWYVLAHMKTGICRLWENLLCCGCCV